MFFGLRGAAQYAWAQIVRGKAARGMDIAASVDVTAFFAVRCDTSGRCVKRNCNDPNRRRWRGGG